MYNVKNTKNIKCETCINIINSFFINVSLKMAIYRWNVYEGSCLCITYNSAVCICWRVYVTASTTHGMNSRKNPSPYLDISFAGAWDFSTTQKSVLGPSNYFGDSRMGSARRFESQHRQMYLFLQNAQTGFGAHPVSYSIGTEGSFSVAKEAGMWLTTPIHCRD
jgi:hypothetical protein